MSKSLLRIVLMAGAIFAALPAAMLAQSVDLSINGVSGSPSAITLGTGNITYTVGISNGSSTAGTLPTLTATLPASSTYVSASATSSGICTQLAGTVTCTWISIPAFNSFSATIVVTPTAGGTLTLNASVAGIETDPNTANNTGSASVTVNSQIDLSISSISGSPSAITLNTGNVTYTTQIFNGSTSQATNPTLTLTLPASSTYVSATANSGGSCSQSAGTVTCNWTSIPAFNSFSTTVVVTPTAGGTATLNASVAATESDPNTADNTASASVTVNSQIDLSISSISGSPSAITLNTGNVTYTTQIFNGSSSQATNPALTLTLPASSTYVSATANGGGSCSQSAGTVTCNWTSILAFNSLSTTVIVTPTAGGTLTLNASVAATEGDPNTANNTGSASVTVNSQIDLSISSISGSPSAITLNTGNATYTTQIFNGSTSQATNPTLTLTLPASSTYVSATANNGGSCSQSAGTVTCNWTSIPAFNSFSTTVVVTPTAGGTATLNASVAATESDPNTANNTASASVTVNSQIDLSISSISGSPSAITLNTGNVTYTTQIFNGSTSQATNPTLTLTLPASSTYVSATANNGGSCSQSAGTVTCNWTSILAFNSLSTTLVVTPTAGGTLTLNASVAATEPDPNTANNTGSASVTCNSQIDLSISGMNGSPNPITFGSGNVTYTVQVFNGTNSQGTNVALTNTLPSNSTYVSSSANNGGSCSQSAGTVTCNWSSLPAFNSFIATIAVTPTIPGSLTLSASVAGTQPDPNTANNTASTTVNVTPTACTPVPAGAVAWYRAESNAADSVGPNTGTTNGGAAFTTGKVGQAFNFNGTTAYVSVPDNTTLRPASLTIEGWVSFASLPSAATIVSKTVGSGTNDSYVIWYQAGALHAAVGNASGNGPSLDYTWTPTINTAYHLAYTYDSAGQAQTLYVDSAIVASGTTSTVIAYDSNPLIIGAEVDNAALSLFFPGRIDELTLYSRALTQTEIQAVDGAGTFGKCYITPTTPGVSGFSPASGIAGTSVVITGTNFIGISAVQFNGTTAAFTVNSTTQISTIVPAGATTGFISVVNDGGVGVSGSPFTVITAAHWINSGGGNWSTSANWSTGAVPTSTNNVFIDATGTYTVALDVAPAYNSLTVGGGATGTQTLDLGSNHTVAFANAGTVTASGALTLGSSSTLTGAGGLTVNGALNWISDSTIFTTVSIAAAGTFNISDSGTRFLDGGTINNSGTVNWSGANNISVFDSGVINNLAGALFSATNDQIIYQHCCTAGQPFNNAGTFRKSVATGITGINNNGFNNTGTVDIQSGTFNPISGGTSSGVFNAISSGTFLFSTGSYTLATGATLTGSGNFQVGGGTLVVNATGVTVTHLTMSSGTLNIAGAVSTSASGVVDWIADSTLTGAGSLSITSGATLNLSGAGTRFIDGGTINNSGTVNWSGANNISVYNSGVIKNLAAGLFSVTNNQFIYQHCCTPGQAFNNAGIFRKTVATGTTGINNNGFNNTGTVDIQSGIFNPISGGTSTSVFNATSGGTFLFSTGSYTLGTGATLTGSGNFQVGGGTLVVNAAPVTVDHLTLSSGTLNIAGGGSVSTAASGVVDWSSDSTLTGAGSLSITSGGILNINGTGTRFIDGGTLNNSGNVNWSGANNISVYDSGVINNLTGAVFSVTNDQIIYQHCCAVGQAFNNAGTFRKTIATGLTGINNNGFNNSGTVDIQSGTFNPISGGTSTSIFNATSTGAFLFSTGSYTLGTGATLTGSGNFQVGGGTLVVNATGVTVTHLSMTSGTLNIVGAVSTSATGVVDWSSDSTLTGAGTLSIGSGGTLNISGAGTRFIDGGTISNSGTVNWSGANNISVYNSGVINNLAVGLFSVTNDQLLYQSCCAAGQAFNNQGTFLKTAATGTTSIAGAGFTNNGTLKAHSGVIGFNTGFTGSGSAVYDFGIGSATNFGRISFANPVTLTGALVAAPVNSFVPQGGQQYQIISFPSGSATFAPKTLTYGSSPTRSFADTYASTSVTLTASGPTITGALVPSQGSSAGGTAVTITGTGFVSGAPLGVTFGGNAATSVTFINSSTVTCTTPAHAAGVVDVVLTNGDGQPTTALGAFTFDAPPVISSIRPSSGSTAGAGGVIIDGTNLDTVTAVDFGGGSGTIIYSSPTELTVAAPAHASGIVNVLVTGPAGSYTLSNGFTYIDNDDPARDFFVSANPSSRWSYGYETTRGSAFVLYPHSARTAAQFDFWDNGSFPNLGRNSGTTTLVQGTDFTPSMAVQFHPGGSGENSVFRWTAPAAGVYRIHGDFVGLDNAWPTTSDVAILENNSTATTLFSAFINAYNVPQTFDVSPTLAAGDTIEFTVGFGQNGTNNGDATGLDVVIDPVPCAPPPATITPSGPTTFCNGGSVTLTASSGVSYQWRNFGTPIIGATAQQLVVTTAGSYTVTVTYASACSNTSPATSVTVNSAVNVTISGATTFCTGGNTTLTANPSGGSGTFTSYQWLLNNAPIVGANASTYNTTAGGNHRVTVTDSNGCTGTSAQTTVTVTSPPPATINAPASVCANSAVVASIAGGGVAGATYTWSVVNGTLQSGQGTPAINFTVGTATPVTLSVVASLNGCTTSGNTSITVGLFIPAITGPTSFCAGGSVTLTSSSGASYQWLLNGSPIGGANAQSYVATVVGNYSVSVTTVSGCSGTSATTTVTQATPPTPTITPGGPTTFCSGGNVTLTSSAASSYQWLINSIPISGATGQSFAAAASGSYSVTVTNGGGCSGTASAVGVTVIPSSTTITAPSSAAPGSTGNVASVAPGPGGSTYAWTIAGGTITSGNGTPSITWTAGSGNSVTISVGVTSGSCTASGTAFIAIQASARLVLTMTGGPNPVNAGGTITFTLNLANSGPITAQNIVVANNLFGVTSPAASGTGWSCTTTGLTVVCTMPALPVGPAAPLTLTATAADVSSAGNSASAVAANSDPNGNSYSANVTIPVNAQPSCNNTTPAPISPAPGATNVANPVNFTWSAVANATSYDLWIASSGAAPAIATTTQSTAAMISLPGGTSTWYVAAHFANCPTLFSAPRDLTIAASANCSHTAPQLVAPSPNAVVNSPVTFSWTPVAQAVGYRLWIALDGGAAQDAGTTNGATSITVALTGSSVAWHVDTIFPGCDPTSSAPSTFTIATSDACAGHAAPMLLAPSPNATLASSVVDFHWTAVAGANGYRLWTSINGAAFAPLGTTSSATTLHTTFTSGTVAWYVEALFNGCASIASLQQSFTIPAAANCNNPAATSLAPANDTTLTNGTVDFSWSAAPNAIGYELWLSLNNGTLSMAGTTTTTTLRRSIGTGSIEWFVRAQFNGCDPVESAHARFTYAPPADCSLLRPILTAPVDGAPVVITPFDLQWSNVPGATQYKVWVASGDGAPTVIGTTAGTHLDNLTAAEGSITWFVDAIFDNCPFLRSTSSTFTAAQALPPCSTPGVPLPRAESTASTNVEYVIRWTPSGPTSTTQYEVQESLSTSFTSPVSITTDASELPFKHINSSDAPIPYYYRVRSVSTCTGNRSLFSLPLAVQVLPSNVTDPASANGSTPADNPQTTNYQIHIGGGTNGSALHKGAIAAAAGDTFTATTNQPWLTVSPSSGTVQPEGTTLTVTATTSGLPVGTSSGAVNITFGSGSGSQHSNRVGLGTTPPATTTTVSVNLVQPVSPTAKNAPPPDALIIPAVAHADGINSKFQSDIRVTNSSAQPMKYQVTFTPTGDTGITQGKQTTLDIDPGHTIALDDVLQSWFGSDGATGTLEVRPLTAAPTSTTVSAGLANILTFAASRTYNTTLNGTFGQYIPAIPFAAFVGRAGDPTKSTILSLQQIAQSPAYRTNLGIVEGSGDPASVLISVFGDNGQKLTEFTQDLKGGQQVQLNSILAQKNVQVSDGRIEVKVVSPVGRVTAYASVIDNETNDPLLVPPVAVNQTASAMYVIPGVADLNNGIANWQTDVRIFNPSTSIVKATLTYYSQSGGTPRSKDISLAPGQVQTFDGALQQLFGISNDGGALHIATTATTPLVATARTYNQTPNGTYGQFVPAVTANDAAALGTRPLQILQIEESDRYRTNVGFAEVTGNAARIEVTAVPSDSKVAASTQIDLAPNQFVQYPQLLKSMGLTNMYNARVTVKVISGQGRVTAYASVIDMQTNDPTFVPAQ